MRTVERTVNFHWMDAFVRVPVRVIYKKKTLAAQDPLRIFISDTLLVLNLDKGKDTVDHNVITISRGGVNKKRDTNSHNYSFHFFRDDQFELPIPLGLLSRGRFFGATETAPGLTRVRRFRRS